MYIIIDIDFLGSNVYTNIAQVPYSHFGQKIPGSQKEIFGKKVTSSLAYTNIYWCISMNLYNNGRTNYME